MIDIETLRSLMANRTAAFNAVVANGPTERRHRHRRALEVLLENISGWALGKRTPMKAAPQPREMVN